MIASIVRNSPGVGDFRLGERNTRQPKSVFQIAKHILEQKMSGNKVPILDDNQLGRSYHKAFEEVQLQASRVMETALNDRYRN